MSQKKTADLNHEPNKIGTNLVAADYHCWPNNTIAVNEFFTFDINVNGATIQGAGIRTHGDERVVVTSNYPGESPDWQLTAFNMEDHSVSFDLYAWYS